MARLRVDQNRCQGHGRCTEVSAELFPQDGLGYLAIQGAVSVPDSSVELARAGALSCPEAAITVELDD